MAKSKPKVYKSTRNKNYRIELSDSGRVKIVEDQTVLWDSTLKQALVQLADLLHDEQEIMGMELMGS